VTVATDASPAVQASSSTPSRRPGTLVAPVIRHLLVFAAGIVIAFYLGSSLAIAAQPTLWLVALGILGLAAGLVSSGWLGLPFLLVGLLVGRLIELQLRFGAGPLPAEELTGDAPLYLAAVVAAAVGYVASVLVVTVFRSRARPRNS